MDRYIFYHILSVFSEKKKKKKKPKRIVRLLDEIWYLDILLNPCKEEVYARFDDCRS